VLCSVLCCVAQWWQETARGAARERRREGGPFFARILGGFRGGGGAKTGFGDGCRGDYFNLKTCHGFAVQTRATPRSLPLPHKSIHSSCAIIST